MIRTQVRTHASTGDKCIRLLMDAEKRGAARVKNAQALRASKIRQARKEAEAEVRDFRDEKEAHVQDKLRQIKKEVQAEAEDYEKCIEEILGTYEENVKERRDEVVQHLLEKLCDINPVVHHNFTIRKQIAVSESVSRLSFSNERNH
ncbi:hypothetical protein FO519_004972 [Halicephalobus sp. NKZ332]|nr:hypothetical protein FO519_004972 [Halicephalobus sp. NKZ332]